MAKTIKMNDEQMGRMFKEIYEDLTKTLEENGFMKIWTSEEMTAEQRKEMISYYWDQVKRTKLARWANAKFWDITPESNIIDAVAVHHFVEACKKSNIILINE